MVEWQYWRVGNEYKLIRAIESAKMQPLTGSEGGATLLWSMKGISDAEVLPACAKRIDDSWLGRGTQYRDFVREAGGEVIVVAEPGYCPCCRATQNEKSVINDPNFYEVTAARATESGWALEGRIQFAPSRGGKSDIQCTCGEIVNSLVSVIPIHFSIRTCSKCGGDGLFTEVQNVKRDSDGYAFEATIKCKGCGRRSILRTLVGKIAEVLKLEIGPTGITICRK